MVLLTALLIAAPVAATEPYLVEVRGAGRRYFSEAPASDAAKRPAYVVAGDQLVAERTEGGFTLATFVTRTGQATRGWIATAALRRLPTAMPAETAWLGTWRYDEASIAITRGGRAGRLKVEGLATWGGHDPARVANGGVNTGGFGGDLRPQGMRLSYRDPDDPDGCRVEMRPMSPYLVARDNGACGGMNVTFNGTYRR